MQRLSPQALQAFLASARPPPLLLDVREPWEFAHCRIDGSVNLPLGYFGQAQEQLDRAACTILICHHGIRSLQAALYLERLGFADVVNLEGGIDAWSREVDPSVPFY